MLRHTKETKVKLRLLALKQFKNGMPMETKKKISKALMGHRRSKEEKRAISIRQIGNKSRLGMKHTKETKLKMSKSARKGEKSNLWRGGITPENKRIRESIEYRLWREAVFARDNWVCQKCEERGGKLHPHHIQNFADYPDLRFAIDNGVTLCEKCHKIFHRGYGVKSNTKNQLEEFLTWD